MERIKTSRRSPAFVVGRLTARSAIARASALTIALAIALIALAGTAGASHSRLEHLSVGEVNGNGAFDAAFRSTSADGSRVFVETSERLVSADTDSVQDVYERSGGQTKLVSVGQANGNGAFNATLRGASADGFRVFFTTGEQLVGGDADSVQDVYERSGGQTKLVSAGQTNGNGAFSAFFAGASADGSRVFLTTTEQLVGADTDASIDLYQRAGGTTKRVSAGQVNGNGAFGAFFAGASADGSRVFLTTDEQLVGADTDAEEDAYERSGGATKLVSAGQVNGNGAFDAVFLGASADGTRVFFETDERLVGADGDSTRDIYQRAGGTTTRISSGNGAFNASFQGASADGSRVFFETSERLVGADTDSSTDVYERSGGSTRLRSAGQVNGNGGFGSFFEDSSADGTRVFFETDEQLVNVDIDSSRDVYERSGGSTKLVSAGAGGANEFDASFAGASADGSRVFFESNEQILAADKDFVRDVYERLAGTTSKVSPGSGTFDASLRAVSADGSAVFFTTLERVIASDEDSSQDVYGAYVAP